MRTLFLVLVIILSACTCSENTDDIEFSENESLTQLSISENAKYLINAEGEPVYLLGGTAWTMTENCTREDVLYYLNDRKNKGFNYVQVVAVRDLGMETIEDQTKNGTMNPMNRYGFYPFEWGDNNKADVSRPIVVEGGSPDAPNDYWDHLDYIVRTTDSMNMYLGLLPTWSKYYINNKLEEMRLYTEMSAKNYGKFLGERYKNADNLIWILGGDIPADRFLDGRPYYRAMAEGIVEGVTGQNPAWDEPHQIWDSLLITYHGRWAASQYFNEDAWLKLNMVYDDDPELLSNIQDYYDNQPFRPMIEGECWYEGWVWDGSYKSAQVIRRQMYHTYFGGALAGFVYGVAMSAPDAQDQVLKFRPGWRDRLGLEAATQIQYLKKILDEHKWWLWEPAQHLILSGLGDGEVLKAACLASDKTEILVYYAANSPATIDLPKLNDFQKVKLTWIDPRNGDSVDGGNYSTEVPVSFDPPDGFLDAVLIIEGI